MIPPSPMTRGEKEVRLLHSPPPVSTPMPIPTVLKSDAKRVQKQTGARTDIAKDRWLGREDQPASSRTARGEAACIRSLPYVITYAEPGMLSQKPRIDSTESPLGRPARADNGPITCLWVRTLHRLTSGMERFHV